MATSSTGRASTSPRGWRAWRNRAGSMSAERCATKFAIGCRSRSRILASTRSRISHARCASSASCWKTGPPPRRARPAEEPLRRRTGQRAPWFSIVARNTSFSYKGKGADSKQIARELGVRYVVEGSLRKVGNRVRISCQLVEAASGQHLWADRFDGTLDDTFDLQDRITESVIGSVGPVLRGAEIERAR